MDRQILNRQINTQIYRQIACEKEEGRGDQYDDVDDSDDNGAAVVVVEGVALARATAPFAIVAPANSIDAAAASLAVVPLVASTVAPKHYQ